MPQRSVLGLSLVVLALVSCNHVSQEQVRVGSPLWGGYSQGAVYELKRDVFLVKLEDKTEGTRYALTPEGSFDHPDRFYTAPRSIAEYKQNDGKLPETDLVTGRAYQVPTTTLGIMTGGTGLKCTSLVKYRQWTWFFGSTSWVTPYCEIVEGSHSGMVVDTTDLSVRATVRFKNEEVAVYHPDAHLLRSRRVGNKRIKGGD